MFSNSHTLRVLSLTILLLNLPQTVLAKSVYVITDTDNATLAAYEIQGTSLAYQTNYLCEPDWGAVGLAIDPDSPNSIAFSLCETRFPAALFPVFAENSYNLPFFNQYLGSQRRLYYEDGFAQRHLQGRLIQGKTLV